MTLEFIVNNLYSVSRKMDSGQELSPQDEKILESLRPSLQEFYRSQNFDSQSFPAQSIEGNLGKALRKGIYTQHGPDVALGMGIVLGLLDYQNFQIFQASMVDQSLTDERITEMRQKSIKAGLDLSTSWLDEHYELVKKGQKSKDYKSQLSETLKRLVDEWDEELPYRT